MKKIRFLAVDVTPEIKLKISTYLGDRYDFQDIPCNKIESMLRNKVFDVYIIEEDFNLCEKIKRDFPASDVLLIISDTDLKRVHFIEQYEIDEVLVKPVTSDHLKFCLLRIIERFKDDAEYQVKEIEDDLGIVGSSKYIKGLREKVLQVASGDFPVLIQGDSGTGKEIVAQAVHNQSERRDKSMVTINCAAIPKHLEESEFFGHRKGSFTGAVDDKEGFFDLAHGSTVFLDEIGETSLEIQAKLLRVLDSGEYRRVGDTKTRQTDLRIISATNRSLEDMVKEKTFREDLYYRIRGMMIDTIPLKDHRDDIPELVHFFLQGFKTPKKFTATAMRFLMEYSWPGNVRELKHTIEFLATAHLGRTKIDAAIKSFLKIKEDKGEDVVIPYKEAKEELIYDWETQYFTNLMAKFGGNVARASRAAKMYRPNFNKKLNDLGISADRFRV